MSEEMTYPWFVWKGTDSRAKGVALAAYPARQIPAPRRERVRIPGRSGSLTLASSEAYDPYRLTLEILVQPEWPAQEAVAWLRGRGTLILGDAADRQMEAEVAGGLSLRTLPGGWHSGTLAFNVQPLKGQFPPEPPIETALFYNLYNPGDVAARPRYTVYGSGLLLLSVGYRPGIQEDWGSQITVDLSETNYTGALIDTESMMVTDPDGVENLNHLSTVYFHGPEGLWVPPGECYISWNVETVTRVKIEPRWRWI